MTRDMDATDPVDLFVSERSDLDAELVAEVTDLLAEVTAADGHAPIGEAKTSQLHPGAEAWTGLTVRAAGDVLVGYAHIRWNAPGRNPRIALEIASRPEVRGPVTRVLLNAVEPTIAAAGGTAHLWTHRVEPAGALPEAMGWTVQRELAHMTRPLDQAPVPVLPEGVTVAAFRPGTDGEAFLRVNNAAFGDHPENGGWDAAELARRLDLDWVDPDGIRCAWRGEEMIAFHWTKDHRRIPGAPADAPGEVYVLAVHPDAQGGGLGRGMLDEGLAHLHRQGCRTVELYVDRASAGAYRLYERNGFELANLDVCWER